MASRAAVGGAGIPPRRGRPVLDPTPLDVAARWLARAARTEAQLTAYLARIGYGAATVDATVARCRELGYVGDAVYARERARGLRARGVGSLRIAADLEARGLPSPLIDEAVEASRVGASELDWARRALAALGRRRGARVAPAKVWRFLLARGFSEETIRDLVPEPDCE